VSTVHGEVQHTAVHDLREEGTTVTWLGFKLTKECDKLRIGISQKTWDKLVENLVKCHTKPNSAQRAAETVFAWIAQQAPALDPANTQKICTRIVEAARTQALEELLSPMGLQERCAKAYERWTRNVMQIDCAWVHGCGSASKNTKAASGRAGGAGERLAPPAPFASQIDSTLTVAGFCITGESRGRGGWAYLLDQGAGQLQQRESASPFTTQTRMELLAAADDAGPISNRSSTGRMRGELAKILAVLLLHGRQNMESLHLFVRRAFMAQSASRRR
jgi:hypothetical protein